MFSEEEKQRIVEEYEKGKVMTEVAEEFDCTVAYVSILVRNQGVSRVQKRERNIEKEKENYGDSDKSDYEFAMYLREKYGWGAESISKVIDVPCPTIGHWIYGDSKPGNTPTITKEHKEKLSERMKKENPMYNKETVEKMANTLSEIFSGEGNPFYGEKHDEEALRKMRNKSEETIEKIRKAKTGENNSNWKGGVSRSSLNGYYGPRWKERREEVLQRDNYKCQSCGSKSNLHVHHIIPFYKFDDYEEANTLPNLITLCNSCHKIADSYNLSREEIPKIVT